MRPVLFGYFRVKSDDSEPALSLRFRIADFADREGFELTNVFVDSALTGHSALTALLVALRSGTVRHVVVPGLDHITRFSYMHGHMRRTLESVTGATVLTLPSRAAAVLSPVGSTVAPLVAPGNGR